MYHLLCNGLELSRQPQVKENYNWNFVVLEESKEPEKELIKHRMKLCYFDNSKN